MTDRYNYLTVVLDRDVRDDDAEPIVSAIGMIRGVVSVKGAVADPSDYAARARVREEISRKLWVALDDGIFGA